MRFVDRTSTSLMRSNQIRLWFSTLAYVLMSTLRKVGLKGTDMQRAQCSTIREKLLKIGAQVKVSVRRVVVKRTSSYPYKELFATVLKNIQRTVPMRC